MLDFLLPCQFDPQRFALLVLGITVFVHLICTANFMPPRSSCTVWMHAVMGVASSVVLLQSVLSGETVLALWASAAVAWCLATLQITLWFSGYHVSKHLTEKLTPKKLKGDCE